MNRNAKKFIIFAVILSLALISHALGFSEQTVRAFSEKDVSSQGLQNLMVVFTSTEPSAQNQAMSNESVGWETYENSQDGYKIQYSQEWKIDKPLFPGLKTNFAVTPNDVNSGEEKTLVSVNVENATKTLDPATLQVQLIPLKQYADEVIQEMTSAKGTPNVLKNEGITFNGQPAWRVDYIHNYLGYQLYYGTDIFVIKDEKLYKIGFLTPPLKVQEMRPIGEKIIQTFQFTNNTKT